MRSSVARPAAELPSAVGMTETSDVPSRRQSAGRRRAADAVDLRDRGGDRAGVARADERVERRQRAGADAGVLELLEPGAGGAGLGERVGLRVAELDRRGARRRARRARRWRRSAATQRWRTTMRAQADQARLARASPRCARPVEPRPDRGEHDRQQGDRDGDADQRDQQPGDADAAQERHRQRDEREQRDRHGGAAEDDGGAGVLHRGHDRVLVGHAAALALLAPADDDEQRVVDRDAEPDQRDEELDDHRDVGDGGERPDQQERRRDGDERHQQRHDRHERARRRRPGRAARRAPPSSVSTSTPMPSPLVLAGGGAQGVEAGDLDGRAADRDALERGLRLARLGLAGVDAALGRDVDEREGRAAVLGDEARGRGSRRTTRSGARAAPPRPSRAPRRARRATPGESTVVPFGSVDDRHERRDVAAVAVDRGELLVGLEALAARDVELLRKSVAGRLERRRTAAIVSDDPEAETRRLWRRTQRVRACMARLLRSGSYGVRRPYVVRCTMGQGGRKPNRR